MILKCTQMLHSTEGPFSTHAYDLPDNTKGVVLSGDHEDGGAGREGQPSEKLSGLDTYPAIFCFPPEKDAEKMEKMKLRHWPTIVCLLSERTRRCTGM